MCLLQADSLSMSPENSEADPKFTREEREEKRDRSSIQSIPPSSELEVGFQPNRSQLDHPPPLQLALFTKLTYGFLYFAPIISD